MENILSLIENVESYGFTDNEGHPIENCKDWHELKVSIGYFNEADENESRLDLGNL